MPTYKIPEPVAESATGDCQAYVPSWPSVRIDVSKEILALLDVGKTTEIILRGKVRALESYERERGTKKSAKTVTSYELCLELNEVELPTEKDFEKVAEA